MGAVGHGHPGRPRVVAPPPAAPLDNVGHVLERLVARGCRLTGPRRAVVEVLIGQAPIGAQALHAALLADGAAVGRATIFRTLDLLEGLGMIERIHGDDGCHAYRLVRQTHLHHLICTDCGARVDLVDCPLEAWLHRLAARTDYQIDGHDLVIHGRCPDCQGPGLIAHA
jgi:Fur family transcriptional regulator, ferric uptake regulator